MFLQHSLGKLRRVTYNEGLSVGQPMHGLLHFFFVQNSHDAAGEVPSASSFHFVGFVVCSVRHCYYVQKMKRSLSVLCFFETRARIRTAVEGMAEGRLT